MSGYVVDAPASVRAVLEPLMAAYDFTVAERSRRLAFFHGEPRAPTELAVPDMAAGAAARLLAQRGDHMETPIEARVRFLDAARDYLIAGVSARRMDNAEGGVATLEAPLVLEVDAAEALARRVLADQRAHAETLRIALGPQHRRLEPGDRVRLAGGVHVFEVERVEETEMLQLDLRRARQCGGAAWPGRAKSAARALACADASSGGAGSAAIARRRG